MRRSSFLAAFSLVSAFAWLLAAPALAARDGYSYARIVRLSLVNGDVQVMRSDESKWEPALLNMPIQQGFVLGTADGRAEVEFENGGALWLAENSVLQFTELALSDGGLITQITVSQGTATFRPSLVSTDSFRVKAPEFEVAPAGKTEFRMDVLAGRASVRVFGGRVEVSSAAGPKSLVKGESFSFADAAPSQASVDRNPAPDAWDQWVGGRANAIASGQNQSLEYTNSGVGYGMSDLSTYGNWGYYPGIGYGWQPFGIGFGWAPFSAGQWLFYPGFGWTWVGAEPWGWLPYHFGGWAFSPVFGWVWVPGGFGFWSPAPVRWVTVGNRLGWIPLAPAHVTSTAATPVVLASKGLGKGGTNKVLSAQEAAGKFEPLSAAPAGHGKFASEPGAGLLAPTASSLKALRATGSAEAVNRGIVNGAASATAPVMLASNGAPPARRNLPSAPAPRMSDFPSGGSGRHGGSGERPASTPAHASSSGFHSSGSTGGHTGGGGGGHGR